MSRFSLAAFKILSLSLKVYYNVSWCGSLWVRLLESVELLWCLYSCLSLNLGSFQLSLLQIFSLFCFWDSLNTCVDPIQFPTGPLGSVHFSSIFFFLFLELSNFHCPILKFADSFFFLLKYGSESFQWIFRFNYCTFQLQNFNLFFPEFSVSSLIVPFHSCIIFLTLCTSSFSSSSIYKTVVIKSLSSISAVRSFLGTVSIDLLLFFFEWTILSPFFVCLVIFLLKTRHLNLIMWLLWKSDSSLFPGFSVFCYCFVFLSL